MDTIGGMTRGFEHRLWGYTVVRIKQPDVERGVESGSTSSNRPLSPSQSLEGQELGEYGKLGVVEIPNEGHPALKKDESSEYDTGDLAIRPVPDSRGGSEETDERESVGEWQIPETVILTSGSIAPF